MALWVKALHQQENLSLDSRHPCKKLGVALCACNTNPVWR